MSAARAWLPGTIDVGGPGPAPQTIRLRSAKITSLLGVEVPVPRCTEILTALEFGVAEAPDGLDVTVPAFRRTDVTREADLIEEVSRLGALESLPATLPSRHGASGRLTDRQRLRRAASDALAAQGLHEIVGWSFEGPDRARQLRIAERPAVELAEPDVERAVTAAHDPARIAARRRAVQPGAGRPGDPVVRGRRRVPGTRRGRRPSPRRALPRRRAAQRPRAARHLA